MLVDWIVGDGSRSIVKESDLVILNYGKTGYWLLCWDLKWDGLKGKDPR